MAYQLARLRAELTNIWVNQIACLLASVTFEIQLGTRRFQNPGSGVPGEDERSQNLTDNPPTMRVGARTTKSSS